MGKLKDWILPKEFDFFSLMKDQSMETLKIVEELGKFYVANTSQNPEYIYDLISKAKKNRSANLKDLNATFITPVDKEAISRVYAQLYWVALSIKHLIVEIDTYEIYDLSEYKNIFDLLKQEMQLLGDGFDGLRNKNYEAALKIRDKVIHQDNELIKQYAIHLAELFKGNNHQHILMHREILSQLKEVSKRIHICANLLEDIVFKLN